MNDRYTAQQNGKDWEIIDTHTGRLADPKELGMYGTPVRFLSRKGFPATSLASRAANTAKGMNDTFNNKRHTAILNKLSMPTT